VSGLIAFKRRAEAAKFEGENFLGLDLRSMKAFGSTWTKCFFDGCELDLADLRNAKFTGCIFRNCEMRLVNFGASFFEDTKFSGCDMEQASLAGCHLRGVSFTDCRMAYGDSLFLDATVRGKVEMASCNFHGSNLDFREVDVGALAFKDCNFWSARVSLGCAFWAGQFDERAIRQFSALLARISGDPRLKEMAGEQYKVVCRAMDGRKSPEGVPSLKKAEG
jgi:uncharacterized protein YjbI with pentapeptide repeats